MTDITSFENVPYIQYNMHIVLLFYSVDGVSMMTDLRCNLCQILDDISAS